MAGSPVSAIGVEGESVIRTRVIFGLGDVGSMAVRTSGRRRLVKEDQSSVHRFLECVARGARNVFMSSLEWKYGLVVIEQ
jgi:hypothetical protein